MNEVFMKMDELKEILNKSIQILTEYTNEIFKTGNREEVDKFCDGFLDKSINRKSYFDDFAKKWGDFGICVPPWCDAKIYSNPPKIIEEAEIFLTQICSEKARLIEIFNKLQNKSLIKQSDLCDAIDLYNKKKYKASILLLYSLIDSIIITSQKVGKKRRKLPQHVNSILTDNILNFAEMRYFVSLNTKYALMAVYQNADDFVDETKYKVLNRSFVSHGMTKRNVTKNDCIMLFLLLYRCEEVFSHACFYTKDK